MKLLTTLLLAASTATSFAIAEDTILIKKTFSSATNTEQEIAEVLPSASVITHWEIEQSPAATIIDLIQSEPGIEIGRNGGPGTVSSIFMRGQASKNLVVFVDGVKLQTDALGAVLFNNIPLSQVERIEILRGNMSALYGASAVGGAIHIFTKSRMLKSTLNAEVKYGSRSTQEINLAFAEVTDKTSYSFSVNDFSTVNKSTLNAKQNPLTDDDSDPFNNSAISTRVEWALSEKNKLGVNLNNSTGEVNYDSSFNDNNFHAEQNSSSIIIFGSSKLNEKLQTSFNINRSTNTFHEFNEGEGQIPKKAEQIALTINNSIYSSIGTINLGAETSNSDYKDAYNRINKESKSLFTGLNGRKGHHFDYQLNFRHDSTKIDNIEYSSSRRDSSSTWLVGSGYKLNESTRASALYSTSFATPTASEFSGNPDLNTEKHKGYEVGIDYSANSWNSRINYFNNKSLNSIVYTGSNYENISYENSGFEFDLSGSIRSFGYSLSHVIQNPKDKTGSRLSRRAKNYTTLELTGLYNTYDWLLQTTHSGDRDDSFWNDEILKSYTVVNFSLSKRINSHWTSKLKIENMFNEKYQLAYGYDAVPYGAFVSIQYQPQ